MRSILILKRDVTPRFAVEKHRPEYYSRLLLAKFRHRSRNYDLYLIITDTTVTEILKKKSDIC